MAAPHQDNQSSRKVLSALLGIAACCWFLFAFSRYAPEVTAAALREIGASLLGIVSRWGFWDALLILWFCVAACLIGKQFLQWLRITPNPRVEDLHLSVVVGIMLISWTVTVLAWFRLLYPAVAYGLLAAPLIVWRRDLRGMLAAVRSWPAAWNGRVAVLSGRIVPCFLIAYALGVLLIVFVSALGPEIQYDPLVVHLKAARTFAQEHRLQAIPEIPQTFFPKNITMLYSLGYLLRGETTAKLLNYLFGLLTLWVTYTFSRRLFSRDTGLVAGAILLASPLFAWEMSTAHLELGFTLYTCLSLYATSQWLENREPGWFRLAVLFTAFSLGTRYQALFSLGSLSLLIVAYRALERRRLSQALREAVTFFSISALGMAPWAVANLLQAHNPVFPFFNEFFQSPYWSPQQTQTALEQQSAVVPITLGNWWAVITTFWDVTVGARDFHGNIGPFYLLLLPLLLLRRPIPAVLKIILAYSFFYWLFWLFTGQHLRYFLAALPGLAVAAAEAARGWLGAMWRDRRQVLAGAAAVLLAFFAILSTPYFEKYGMEARYGYRISETLPWRFLLGQESREDYLARHVLDYPLVQRLNRLPGRKNVLFWWSDPQPAVLHLNGQAAFIFSSFSHQLFAEDDAQLHAVLRANGVTHVIVGQTKQEADLLSDPERSFVQRYLKRLDRRNTMVLYEVLPEPVLQEITAYNFLAHIEQARITMSAAQPDKPNYEFRVIQTIADDPRYALVTFPPAEVAFEVTVPARAVLRFAVGRLFPPCDSDGSFQVWIESAGGERHEIYRRNLRAASQTFPVGWYEEEVDLARYAQQPVQVNFKNEYSGPGDCNWFLWADPVMVVPPEARPRPETPY